jgi:hypothetical protein
MEAFVPSLAAAEGEGALEGGRAGIALGPLLFGVSELQAVKRTVPTSAAKSVFVE